MSSSGLVVSTFYNAIALVSKHKTPPPFQEAGFWLAVIYLLSALSFNLTLTYQYQLLSLY
jgi:hypothetical protein